MKRRTTPARRSGSAPACIRSRTDGQQTKVDDMKYQIEFGMGRRLLLSGLASASLLLVACGADQVAGIQGSGAPVASGVTSVGPVTGFGSVFVDGVEYATSAAQIRIE